MAVASEEQILEMLVKAEDERRRLRNVEQFYIYGEAGMILFLLTMRRAKVE